MSPISRDRMESIACRTRLWISPGASARWRHIPPYIPILRRPASGRPLLANSSASPAASLAKDLKLTTHGNLVTDSSDGRNPNKHDGWLAALAAIAIAGRAAKSYLANSLRFVGSPNSDGAKGTPAYSG